MYPIIGQWKKQKGWGGIECIGDEKKPPLPSSFVCAKLKIFIKEPIIYYNSKKNLFKFNIF